MFASLLKKRLNEMKGIKHFETLKLTFKKTPVDADKNEPRMIFKTAYFSCKAKTIINQNEIKLKVYRHQIKRYQVASQFGYQRVWDGL